MKNKKLLLKKIWGKNAIEVMDFIQKENLSIKESFLNEDTFMNYLAIILIRFCKKKIDKNNCFSKFFWENRIMSIQKSVDEKRKAKNILYIIRLLNGTVSVPLPEPETTEDREAKFSQEESFWEEAEKKREEWIYSYKSH